jgi:hypothetical protein
VILVFIRNNKHSRKDIEATFKDLPTVAKGRLSGPIDILKKIDVVNVDGEVVRDFQTARAQEFKAIC